MYIVVVLSPFIFAPCTTMLCVYMRVLRVAHRFIMRSKGRTSKGNITGQMAGKDEKANRVFAMFLLCWLPLICINICWILNQSRLVTNEMIFASFFMLLLNSIFDSFICAFYKRDFRGVFRKKFKFSCIQSEQRENLIDSEVALKRLLSATKSYSANKTKIGLKPEKFLDLTL